MNPHALRLALAYQAAKDAGFTGLAAALLADLRAELRLDKAKNTLDD